MANPSLQAAITCKHGTTPSDDVTTAVTKHVGKMILEDRRIKDKHHLPPGFLLPVASGVSSARPRVLLRRAEKHMEEMTDKHKADSNNNNNPELAKSLQAFYIDKLTRIGHALPELKVHASKPEASEEYRRDVQRLVDIMSGTKSQPNSVFMPVVPHIILTDMLERAEVQPKIATHILVPSINPETPGYQREDRQQEQHNCADEDRDDFHVQHHMEEPHRSQREHNDLRHCDGEEGEASVAVLMSSLSCDAEFVRG
ncbi:hypothetical protein P153DRAFT_392722 [Dothidotthia symphoricarpi CBS 119687]|uniref:Uncharacterized protein n=1 Tax=Dothidotthia symphoricarpi CBS 119687 TaxID=1392245 RepID=A0A6A6ASC8_9PLEO|nr:uncharacterized protein P153DRAFT_392722 [Dothidotthia symphoricarpi CBS 119687]KAF2134113.1 hypothetical protein P153DRAFT_392722 [Dothidotthia symphoricarpi CBS 119687]